MQLLADRFVVGDDKTGVDLATGDPVVLTIASAGGESEQRRWALRCGELQKLRRPVGARLIDYGAIGESQRFEAWDRGPVAEPSDRGGERLAEQPAIAALAELFEACDIRPRVAALWGADEEARRAAVGDLARAARLAGFVPIAARLAWAFGERLRGRSLLLIEDGGPRQGLRAWLAAVLVSARPHVLLLAGPEEVPGVDGARLYSCDGRSRPARLVQTKRHLRAAEQSVAYGQADPGRLDETQVPAAPLPRECEWPAPGELATLRRRVGSGARLVQAGRHASGERVLRQAIGALTRRGDWVHAGEGGLALASMCLRRGRPRDAQAALLSAADCWRRAGDESRLIEVAVLTGEAWKELTRLDEAEASLSAAVTAAGTLGDSLRAATARLALASVLFWRGRYDEAEQMLASIDLETVPGVAVSAMSLRSMVAVGTRHLDRAVSQALEALGRAQRAGDPRLVAEAAGRVAFAHLAVGDAPAVERDAVTAVAAARMAHEPLAAAECRLVLVEAYRRSGRRAAAARLLARIRGAGSRLPPLAGARCDVLRDLLAQRSSAGDVIARHVAATGLAALALLAPDRRAPTAASALDPMADDIIGLLDVCQTSDDEGAVLATVCRRLRERLHGAAAACASADGDECHLIAAAGRRIDLAVAGRAVAAGATIPPHRCENRVEAAAPIRYGGRVIGALAVRWTVGAPYDLSRAASLLTAAAAASAPIVSGAIERRRRRSAPAAEALLGASEAMAAVRQGVERAAAAPFAVLIEGESGSGKELVARALHRGGPRRDRPFCTLNCAALPDDLVEAELFGHARGAFTGALVERPGLFQEAHTGTLLLDEVGELSPRAQAKLLRVIQEGELRRIGENVSRRVDVRIVSATNRDLRQEVAAGRFRLDLLYRLDVVRITVPPLRERREDIAVLAEHFWREAAARVGSRATLSAAAVDALTRYDWPGNAREIQNVLASLAVRSPRRGVIAVTALGPQFTDLRLRDTSRLEEARRTFEERFVRAALVRAGGHRARAADELGVTRQGLTKLLSRLGIQE